MAERTPHSLRARLQGFLLLAILLTALVQAVFAYRTARAEADGIFDYHMQQMAQSLRHGLPVGIPVPELGPDSAGPGDDFVVQIWAFNGARIFQSEIRSQLPERALLGFSNVRSGGTTYRVFSMETRDHVIQVAQDMAIRDAMASGLALRSVLPVVVMAPLLMLIAWWVVRTSLAPVNRVRHQVAARRADDLAEVSDAGLPDEVRPLVQELNLLFQRVRRAFDAQQSFVADAAHELRSPLAALKLQAEGLRRAADDAERERAVARLSAGIDRAARLVDQLLVLARQQANEANGTGAQPVQLDELARQAVAEAAGSALTQGIDVGLSEAHDVRIDGHPEALAILLRNLIDNAVKYTPRGGRVDVAVRRQAGAGVLSVDDSGPGIAPEDRERVVDRFYRAAGTQTPGSGLGLAIVKSIADAHRATLSLDRSAELGGLRVQLEFPASGAASA